jgi:glycosyltransferase involved in cell wall biosynthesis
MKIAIDIKSLNPEALRRGVGFYALNLHKALSDLNDDNQYFLIAKKSKRVSCQLIHYPYFDPFFLTLPVYKRLPTVVTVHDLTPLKFPQHYPPGLKGALRWQIQKLAIKNTRHIFTDSKNSKKDMINLLSINPNKISAVYLAADAKFKKLNSQELFNPIRRKYKLKNKFLLYVGDVNWNKNVLSLLEGFLGLEKDFENLKLVLVGSAFKNTKLAEVKKINSFISKNKLKNKVVKTGFINNKDLVALYNMATLYVQPSFYEGFGLPVLEALSCGCPVLSSDQASLPEVGGQAVEYFNPHVKGSLKQSLLKLLQNKARLQYLGKRGLVRSKKFSWQKTALETKKVYQSVLNS